MFFDFCRAAISSSRASGPVGLGETETVADGDAIGAATGAGVDGVVQPPTSSTVTAARTGWYDFKTSPMIDMRR
ncbi:hypothetical protein Q0Z83_005820 [Actinoplanes sichuanensis]|nr:hypothetical protein Q0Z83_005820 [Actinoplanes sichuanensis]